ncbi:MAG: hypothetical protein H5U13_10070 [Parvibaculum sp.]|nr:hypothetical protein [Parvibaculum sp.]
MQEIVHDQTENMDISPFSEIIGDDIAQFIFERAPKKVATRVANALRHYTLASKLVKIDEEMGAVRLIAAEEELVVAVFEWLKLNSDSFPEHRDFVRKFKNHLVKLSFYPVLLQFRFVLSDMIEHGFAPEGLEGVVTWTARPILDGKEVKLAIRDKSGKELIRNNPFAVNISHGDDSNAEDVAKTLLADLSQTIVDQHGSTLRQFLTARADFRNLLLYASDGGSARLGDSLESLLQQFRQTYHDILWVLALCLGSKPPSNEWGIASQFIATYRLALIEAGAIRSDNTVIPDAEG